MTTQARVRRAACRPWFALLASVLIVLAACGSPAPTPVPSAVGPSAPAAPSTPPVPTAPSDPNSSSLIEAAEQAGTIDHDTALLYQLYSALDYGRLPAAYQSDNPAAPEATAILAELSLRLPQMSADLRAAVAPYFKRPSDPSSVWARRPATSHSNSAAIVLAAYSVDDCPQNGTVTHCVDAGLAPIRVWYPALEGLDAKAAALAAEIDRSGMWDKEQAAMLGHTPCGDAGPGRDLYENGGDDLLDIYLIPTGFGLADLDFSGRRNRGVSLNGRSGRVSEGVTVADGTDACGTIPFIALDGGLDSPKLEVAAAHELFHAFEFSFKNSLEHNRMWWVEASATWAQDLVYPANNDEQGYLANYWSLTKGAEGPLDRWEAAANPQYAAYLWAFYLRQKLASTDGSAIGRLWKASETEDPIHVMGALDGWAAMFKEFALWNWNNDDPSLVRYKDEPGGRIPAATLSQLTSCMMADGCQANADGSERSVIANGKHTIAIDARYTSAQYLAGVPEIDVGSLRFDLSAVKEKPGIGIQAIVWIGSSPSAIKVEDWSNLGDRRFCLNSEDVRKIVLVVSNSAVDPVGDFKGSINVEASENGCAGWVGEIHALSTAAETGGGVVHETSVTRVHFTRNPWWTTASDVEFFSDSGTVTWTWDYTGGDCSVSASGSYELLPYDRTTIRSEGELDFLPPPGAPPAAPPGSSPYALRQYRTGGISRQIQNLPICAGEMFSRSAPGVAHIWWNIQKEAGVKASADGLTIEGSWSFTGQGGDFKDSYTWTLRYIPER
jgi:hypothetical protein